MSFPSPTKCTAELSPTLNRVSCFARSRKVTNNSTYPPAYYPPFNSSSKLPTMSFLEDIVEIIGNNGAASAALESTINGLGEAVEGGDTIDEETQEGMKDSQEAIKDVVSSLEKGEPGAAEEAEALENKMAKMDAWEGPKALANSREMSSPKARSSRWDCK